MTRLTKYQLKMIIIFLLQFPFIAVSYVAGFIYHGLEAGAWYGYNLMNHTQDKIEDIEENEVSE